MKKILVPTDFSPVADNAMQYAIEIAAEFKSEIYLYHVYYVYKIDPHFDLPKDDLVFKKEVEQSMKRTKLKFAEKLRQKGLTVQTKVEPGNIFSQLKRKAQKHEIDLIVMGTKGASGLTKVFFGSVAATVLETTIVPVLVVPPNYSFRPLEHIVLAIDHREVSLGMLAPLQKLAIKFGAKVTILNVNTDSNKKACRMTNLGIDVETTYRELPRSKGINESINDFIGKESCDLLCMIRREKGFFERFFNKSITKAQAFNSQVPLLVLPEKGEIFGG